MYKQANPFLHPASTANLISWHVLHSVLLCVQRPDRAITFVGGQTALPSCHAYHPAADGNDLLIGFNSGDGTHFAVSALHVGLCTENLYHQWYKQRFVVCAQVLLLGHCQACIVWQRLIT
jgi:hypothetical protein